MNEKGESRTEKENEQLALCKGLLNSIEGDIHNATRCLYTSRAWGHTRIQSKIRILRGELLKLSKAVGR